MTKNYKKYLLALGLGVAVSPLFGVFSAETAVEPEDNECVETQEPAPDPAVILSDEATELYKKVKFMQYEGEIESTLYLAAYDAVEKACEAYLSTHDSELRQRNENIIVDLNPLLLQGASYFSTNNDNPEFVRYARLIVDSQNLPGIDTSRFHRDSQIYPVLVYNAAYGASNAQENDKAKEYFKLYLATGDQRMRENVMIYLGQMYLQEGNSVEAEGVLCDGAREYPANVQLLMLAMQSVLDNGDTDKLQPLLDRALIMKPDDERLLNIQARMSEQQGDFKNALEIYQQIAETHPNSLENTRRMATCRFNLGAYYYNGSIMESDEKTAAKLRRQSKAYLESAAKTLEQVLATTPSDMKFLRALAQTYALLGERDSFEDINTRISALGGDKVAFNDMPVMMGEGSIKGNDNGKATHSLAEVPDYEIFARPYIEKHLAAWAQKGEFEKFDDYKKRIAGGGGVDTYNRLNEEAAAAYLEKYGRRMVLKDLTRSDYDIENETYCIETPYGPTVVKVPLKNKEAEAFKAGWETMQIRSPKFIIKDNKVAIGEITYVVNGKKYTYSANQADTYRVPDVHVDINGILAAAQTNNGSQTSSGGSHAIAGVWTESDVDKNIPVTGRKADQIQALIIANEDYDKASSVFGALHDGATMREYFIKTLGIPEHQVLMVNNATGNQVRDALEQLRRRVKGTDGDAEVIFYYAGHGLPDDATKDAYMMPVDANPLTISTLIPMKEIYGALRDMNASAVSVFLDACFSGEGRDGSTINEARGVALKAKEIQPEGNMFVLSAASAQETAMPYKEKHHGLFTYFLLKKLQESKGNATLKELSDYVVRNVRMTSNSNPSISKEQNPTVATSGEMTQLFDKRTLKRK